MSRREQYPKTISDRALEMIMRDVMDGVMELSLESALTPDTHPFRILHLPTDSVENKVQNERTRGGVTRGDILTFPKHRRLANA